MDKVIIKNILARGIIGINDWEREKPQDILINIELYRAELDPAASNDINQCLDYSKVTKKVIKLAESANRFTVEALAQDIASLCLEDPRILKITVRVEKPGAVRFAQSAGVEIERTRQQD